MKNSIIKQFKVIQTDDPKEFEHQLNSSMSELAANSPDVEVEFKSGFKALITYTVKKEIPETIQEQFNAQGVSYKCSNCPNCTYITKADGSIDKRQKRGICPRTEYGHCLINGEACEWFYEAVANGDIEPVKEVEEC